VSLKIRFLGGIAESLSAQSIAATLGAEVAGVGDDADLLVMRPEYLDDLIEDAAATAAYHRTRGQETVPIELVDRMLAGENPVRLWREHRGLTLEALAAKAGVGKGYLSQIETGARKGPVETRRKIAVALGVDLDDL
jgi:DNA-binding XRE family transcriptional regulator